MTKRDVLNYVTRGIIKAAAENIPFITGKLMCSYGEKANIIIIKAPEEDGVEYSLTFYLWFATGGQYSVYMKRPDGTVVVDGHKEGLYFYDGGDNKTDLQRKVLQKAEEIIQENNTIYKGEVLKCKPPKVMLKRADGK